MNVPYDVKEGVDVEEVKNKIVVHRMDCKCQVEKVEHPVRVIRFDLYRSSWNRKHEP